MTRATIVLATLAVLAGGSADGEPFVPSSDAQVLERLPYKAADPVMAQLRAERDQLRQEPQNLRLAVRLAGRYIELGRVNGDPRYAGYAQAALMPWWNLERPPAAVLLLRANLRQHVHDFAGALADLDAVLHDNPWNAQARLTRATVLQVQGRYAAARGDCIALRRLSEELVATACLTNVASVTGHLRESLEQLSLALGRHPETNAAVRSWVLTDLAEMTVRQGRPAEAESYFRAALEVDPSDFYLLGAYADFLLDQQRPAEAADLLADKTRADPLLLRYALALKAQRSPLLPATTEQLRARFDASRLRGDRVHLREEARFTLHILGDAPRALQLAKDNWAVQKEVADVRILLEAALACTDAPSIATVSTWVRQSALEDVHIQRLMQTTLHPDQGALRTSLRP